jgi:chitin disaccharide deacetylase
VATSFDVMMDTPGTVDALRRLKAFPWISVGWHLHMWGSPLLDPNEVLSLVMEDEGRICFRKDLRMASDVVFEEALAECHAQMELCVRILAKARHERGQANE